jgi:hypothetical protein
VLLNVLEEDPFSDDFLGSLDLSSRQLRIAVLSKASWVKESCRVKYRYDKEVTLVVPLPSYGQTVVIKA